jgi:hypothetical protein
MPFFRKSDMPEKFKADMNKALRDKLRKALADPTLAPDQKAMVKNLLESIGKTKAYDPKSPPKEGAIAFK